MQNLFMPSETVACIEQKYVGKTYKIQGKAYTEPFTKEKIRSLFGVYTDAINQVFGGRAIVMQKTRAIKGGTIVPITSFEYVYSNKQSISTYVDEGYYALTINGYRMRDIMDSAYHYFTDNLTNGGKIIESISMILDVSKEDVKSILVKFFCNNGFETFDAFLRKIMETGKMDVYTFDVCASLTCSFCEPVPAVGTADEIQVMNRRAQDDGIAVDECDLDGWKGKGTNGRTERNVCDFFNQALEHYERFGDNVPADDQDKCECSCNSCKCNNDTKKDDLSEIREDVDKDVAKNCDKCDNTVKNNTEESVKKEALKDTDVDISTASDGNNYTYSITWKDNDGKQQTKTFYGEAAKKMMTKTEDETEHSGEKTENDSMFGEALRLFDKRLNRLEGDMTDFRRGLSRRRVFDPWFDLFGGF